MSIIPYSIIPPFNITAPPSTDAWRKPPSTDVFNAPTYPLLPCPIPLETLDRARLTLSGAWTTRYDQGGLLLHLTHPDRRDKWLKTGIEFYEGAPHLSTVGTDQWSDWSVIPPTGPTEPERTVEVRREQDENGISLWVYELLLGAGGEVTERIPAREVTWFFAEEGQGWQVQVSAMAARPAGPEAVVSGPEGLVVSFEGAQVDVRGLV